MVKTIEEYFASGCGRCSLFQTPQCKVFTWQNELQKLRQIILKTELKEEMKWGAPCYSYNGKNLILIQAFKHNFALSFFKGALLRDESNILEKPGENTRASRVIRFQSLERLNDLEEKIEAYLLEAIALEKSGIPLEISSEILLVEELQERLEQDPALKTAFEALTKGRQRGYNLYFAQAKQSKTRTKRIEKYIPKILEGKGFHD